MKNLPVNALFELIKSMSKSEKRHFKLSASFHGEEENLNYVKLFDIIESQIEYDETEIKKQQVFRKHLSKYKARLYDSILHSIRSYSRSRLKEEQVVNAIVNCRILLNRNLAVQALVVIERGIEIAVENEMYSYQSILQEIKIQLLHNTYFEGMDEDQVNELFKHHLLLIDKNVDEVKAQKAYSSLVFYDQRVQDLSVGHFKKQLIELEANQPNSKVSFFEKVRYSQCKSIIYKRLGKDNLAFVESLNLISLFEDRPQFIYFLPNTYMNGLTNAIYYAQNAGLNKEALEYIKKALRAYDDYDIKQNESKCSVLQSQILYNLFLGKSAVVKRLVMEYEDYFKRIYLSNEVIRIQSYLLIAQVCFIIKEFKTSRSKYRLLLSMEHEYLKPIKKYIKLLELLTEYELGNYFNFEEELSKLKNRIFRSRNITESEVLFAEFLVELGKLAGKSKSNTTLICKKYLDHFEKLKFGESGLSNLLTHFNIVNYLKSKAEKVQLMKIYERS